MEALPLVAVAPELVYLGAAVAVALLLSFQLRLSQRFAGTHAEVQRLKKAHREGTLDARSRLEEASKALERLEETVAPRLEGLEPHLADIGSRLDEMEERVQGMAPSLEAAQARWGEAEETMTDARAHLDRAEEAARGAAERFGELDEALRDARTRLGHAEEGLDHLRSAFEQRLGALEARIVDLAAAPALGGEHRPMSIRGEGAGARRAPTDLEDDDGPGGSSLLPTPDAASADRPAAEDDETGPGVRSVLLLLLVLGALTLLFHWLDIGR